MRWLFLLASAVALQAQTGRQVLLVVNGSDPVSRQLGDYYRQRRAVPPSNVCVLQTHTGEEIDWQTYVVQVERPVEACLQKNGLRDQILYIALTMGVPLKIQGSGEKWTAEYGSVDSELALLYGKMLGDKFGRAGPVPNPFFMQRDAPFQHPRFRIYLVTRLAAYDLAGAKAMIDRSLAARNRGKFVIDWNGTNGPGNEWLATAAMLLPRDRVVQDSTPKVLYGQKDVIGYASWGSNDGNRKQRWTGFEWLPGAIATEYVSTNARTLKRPPDSWNITSYEDRAHFFAESPQSMSLDYIQEGASGVSGNTYEPFLTGCARPDYLLPAYYEGRNLAESYYQAIPFLSWQGVVIGDPLCSLGKP
ncbi:MAG TPA: TIGR03790 family protein [Bryobacteraceae bacterium]|nr:TIGR03790 family protein [Bryobacteraceae bacterium]